MRSSELATVLDREEKRTLAATSRSLAMRQYRTKSLYDRLADSGLKSSRGERQIPQALDALVKPKPRKCWPQRGVARGIQTDSGAGTNARHQRAKRPHAGVP